ncbi:MAG TPA: acVLRF1 family peptidyl-tRNA hydrolase [Nocardioidaceae bacterium]|nr:acVLRF1 family peptidyl-tRNA hydrolase [Nocardioidaceae bacterium]
MSSCGRWASTSEHGAGGASRRIEVAGGRLAGWVERFAARHAGITATLSGCGADHHHGQCGDVVRVDAGDGSWAEVEVPWPPLPPTSVPDPLTALLDHVSAPRQLALVLARKGGYAVGVLDGDVLVQSKVGSRHVQGRTKAGGWSQQRYARRRAQQARQAHEAASDVVARMLLPLVQRLDGLVPGGDRRAVDDVLGDPRLRPLDDLPRGRFLAVPDPRQRVLERAAVDCRGVVVHVADVTRG